MRRAAAEPPLLPVAPHRLRQWVGGGWWRRRELVAHAPAWYAIAGPASDGRTLYACGGHPSCIATAIGS